MILVAWKGADQGGVCRRAQKRCERSLGDRAMDDEERQRTLWPSVPTQEAHWVIRVFSSSRYFASFAVLGTFLAAITLYVYGTLVVIQFIWHTLEEYRISVEGVK